MKVESKVKKKTIKKKTWNNKEEEHKGIRKISKSEGKLWILKKKDIRRLKMKVN